ncbi:MAG: hypothetical protein J5606_07675 [Bacteroidales bacterium]|nr:hypothetical protein [Bacteroidales bacterium]
MDKRQTRFHIIAIILLAVYLPMLICTAVHSHDNGSDDMSCNSSKHSCESHHGHLIPPEKNDGICLLCSFAQLVYTPSCCQGGLFVPIDIYIGNTRTATKGISQWYAVKSTRASPLF